MATSPKISKAKSSLAFLKKESTKLEQHLKLPKNAGKDGTYAHLLTAFPPLPEGEKSLEATHEYRLQQVDHLLCMGAGNPSIIAKTLGCNWTMATKLIEQSRLRRIMEKKTRRVMRVSRDEARDRLNLMMAEAWSVYHGPGAKDMAKLQALSTLITINDRLMILDNLTPKTIPNIQEEEESSNEASVDARMMEHGKLLRLANELAKEVIDGECTVVADAHVCSDEPPK